MRSFKSLPIEMTKRERLVTPIGTSNFRIKLKIEATRGLSLMAKFQSNVMVYFWYSKLKLIIS